MTSQAVERTRICTGGYGRLRGECVLITKPKSRLLPIFSPDFTLNSQIWLFYAEEWIFLKKLCTLLKIRNGYTDCVSSLLRIFWEVMSGRLSITYNVLIECFHSRGQHLCKFIGTKESVCIRKEFNSQRIGLGHQHGRRFIVLGHQYGRRDVIWKHSIDVVKSNNHKETTNII